MEQQYMTPLIEAYRQGYERKYKNAQEAPEKKEHYFKVEDDLPRVQVVLGFLRGIVAAGQCQSLLDVGSGRGVFLFPLLRDFSDMEVTSLDILPHRVELLQCLNDGGICNLHPIQADVCTFDAPDKSFDVVTMLEVMEHIPDTGAVVRNAVRLARNYVIVSVPSKPDDNPEHIHLFTNEDLTELFMKNGCRKVKFMSVTDHRVMVAHVKR
ncbi:MAG: class I SAM-dependent methyltransferase [Bacteroidaceae bacterium]|nr:class I SAM-dependent methyltransferase [Bacteroidaceae bacterium]